MALARYGFVEWRIIVHGENPQQSTAARRRRLLDRASLAQRVKWKVTGVPVKMIDGDDDE